MLLRVPLEGVWRLPRLLIKLDEINQFQIARLAVEGYPISFELHEEPCEFSRIVIRWAGRRVFEIWWNELRDFKTVNFDPRDEWEDALIAECEANYF